MPAELAFLVTILSLPSTTIGTWISKSSISAVLLREKRDMLLREKRPDMGRLSGVR